MDLKVVFGFVVTGAIVAWGAYTLSGGNAQRKLENGCAPILGMGKAARAVVGAANGSVGPQTKTYEWFQDFEYRCRFAGWKTFFEDDYRNFYKGQGAQVPLATPIPKQEAALKAGGKPVTPTKSDQ